MDLEIPEGSEHDYTVKFLAPVDYDGVLEICSLAVIQVGANLPCLMKQMIDDDESYRYGKYLFVHCPTMLNAFYGIQWRCLKNVV